MSTNLEALRAREPKNPALSRYDDVARLLTGNAHAAAADGVRWVGALVADLKIPALGTYGITRADFPAIVEASAKASSMKANPIGLTSAELHAILDRAV